MPRQSSNRVGHARMRETIFGVTPNNPAFRAIRTTGGTLSAAPQTAVSEEIRSDRQVSDLVLVGMQASGDVNGELSFGAYDDEFEEALQSTWDNSPAIVNTAANTPISAVSATAITVASGGAVFVAGALVLLQGFPTAVNNRKFRLTSSTATTLTFPAATFTAEASVPVGASIRMVGFQGAAGDFVATATGLTCTAANFTTFGLSVGEWIKIGGSPAVESFNTLANNDWVRISAISATALTFDRLPTGWAADTGAAKTISIFAGDVLRNATTSRSVTIEKQYLDHSPTTFEYLRGLVLNRMSLNLAAARFANVAFSYLGRDGATQTVRLAGATDVAAPTRDVLNASSHVGRIGLGSGIATAGPNFIMSLGLEIQNNIRLQNAVGSLAAIDYGNGEFTVTGNLRAYFGDAALLQAAMANTPLPLDLRLINSTGLREGYVFDMPRVKLSSATTEVPGKNQDVMVSSGFSAMRDPTLGYTVGIGRIWYSE